MFAPTRSQKSSAKWSHLPQESMSPNNGYRILDEQLLSLHCRDHDCVSDDWTLLGKLAMYSTLSSPNRWMYDHFADVFWDRVGQTFTLTAQTTCPLFSPMSRISNDGNCFHCCYYTPNQKAAATIQCFCHDSQHQITRKRLLPYNVFVTIRSIK